MSNSLKSSSPLLVPCHVCPMSLCHVLAPTPMNLSVPLLPVTFAWVPGSELLLMSHAFNLWIILFAFPLATSCWPKFKAKFLSLVSTRKHSHKAFMSTAKSQLQTNRMHPLFTYLPSCSTLSSLYLLLSSQFSPTCAMFLFFTNIQKFLRILFFPSLMRRYFYGVLSSIPNCLSRHFPE